MWGNKTCRSTSNKQSWASWFVKKWTLWRCGIGLNILLPTAVPVVCLSYCWQHGLEYHYDITVSDHTKYVIPHCHTFGLLSHHGRLGAGWLPAEIAVRWRYRPPIKNMTEHYNSQFCVSFHCCLLQEAQKRLWTCLNGVET